METRTQWKDQPWKRANHEVRTSAKQLHNERKGMNEREAMELQANQKVIVECQNELFGFPDMFHRFLIRLRHPMNQKEFMDRMKRAFPECEEIHHGDN